MHTTSVSPILTPYMVPLAGFWVSIRVCWVNWQWGQLCIPWFLLLFNTLPNMFSEGQPQSRPHVTCVSICVFQLLGIWLFSVSPIWLLSEQSQNELLSRIRLCGLTFSVLLPFPISCASEKQQKIMFSSAIWQMKY